MVGEPRESPQAAISGATPCPGLNNPAGFAMKPATAATRRLLRHGKTQGRAMKLTRKVRDILSHYESDNPGTKANLARILMNGRLGGTGKLVILPVDQGFEHGPARSFAPNPPAYDPAYHFQLAIDAGLNAYASLPGFIEGVAADFAGEIPLILKLNAHDLLHEENEPMGAQTASV